MYIIGSVGGLAPWGASVINDECGIQVRSHYCNRKDRPFLKTFSLFGGISHDISEARVFQWKVYIVLGFREFIENCGSLRK